MIRNLIGSLVLAVLVTAAPHSANAERWIFQPSYAQSLPMPGPQFVEATRRPPAGPFFTAPQGTYVRGQVRISRTWINIGGRAYDQTTDWSGYIQGGNQY